MQKFNLDSVPAEMLVLSCYLCTEKEEEPEVAKKHIAGCQWCQGLIYGCHLSVLSAYRVCF